MPPWSGGKRIRPYLLINSAAIFNVHADYALRAAAAIEMLHCYSLVHDDLPAMDNSDLRRGQPTAHKKFDEATAILAGDGLLTMAFEVLAHPDTHPDGDVRAELCLALAISGGAAGMVGGQMIDLAFREQGSRHRCHHPPAALEDRCHHRLLLRSRRHPRPRLQGTAPRPHRLMPMISAWPSRSSTISSTPRGTPPQTGKPTGADAAAGKATFVSILGLDRARQQATHAGRPGQRPSRHVSATRPIPCAG
jgi:farnesyl diphosphate synthase